MSVVLLARALALARASAAAAAGAPAWSCSTAPCLQHLAAASSTPRRGFAAEAATPIAAAATRGDGKQQPRGPRRDAGRRRRAPGDDRRFPLSRRQDAARPEDLALLRGTWPVRVAPALDALLLGPDSAGGGNGGGGGGSGTRSSPPRSPHLRTVGDALRRALSKGPDGLMLATRADVLAFLGLEGGEAALVAGARGRISSADADADANPDADADADADGRRGSRPASFAPPPPPAALLPRLLAVPELDPDFRPVAWWVALPSAAARERALAACDGRPLGAGAPCRVTAATAEAMVAATQSGWRLLRRLAARSGGEVVLMRGLPLGAGGEVDAAAATPTTTTTAATVRAALMAAGLELRSSKTPVVLLERRSPRGRWQERRSDGGQGAEAEDEEEDEDEDEDGDAGGAAAKKARAKKKQSGQPDELAALVWLASPDEARRCERELHGRPLPIAGDAAAAASALGPALLSVRVLP
jgi:hypothetical protein